MSPHDTRSGADACAAACPLAAGTVGRRAFLSQAVLAAAAAALAACGGADGLTAPSSIGSSITVASYPALASAGGVAVVSLSGTRLAIVRTGSATFEALSLVCPHEGGSINTSGTGFLCSKHGAQFDAAGTWVGGQRTTSMRSYPTTFDETAGTLTIG
jgi:nitrite reductase/ring-hydroxylating ferredoxin subunit